LRVPENFRAVLPFSDELALAVLKSELATGQGWVTGATGPDGQDHVTLNCFDGSAHMFFSWLSWLIR
jgi:hypothetical protein